MWAFSISAGFFFFGLIRLWDETPLRAALLGRGKSEAGLLQVRGQLLEIQELLEAGSVPEAPLWAALSRLPEPWGALITESIASLREQGGSVLPTLRRLRALAETQKSALEQARARSAQALSQAALCGSLVPIFGLILYWLVPGLDQRTASWTATCAVASLLAIFAVAWIFSLAETARWGGLNTSQRVWILSSQCAAERFLASIRSGMPTDLAWTRACAWLSRNAPELAREWGADTWAGAPERSPRLHKPLAKILARAADSFRKAIQVSLMEGRPCTERIETQIEALRSEIQSEIDRELGTLPTRALKPLFLFVAPALLGQLAAALYLCWTATT